ncbi:hypothetical protein [Flaviaesturariibacter amylovorans]|uniref:SGNH/GDSL hydrolase family protein n=1 Tax=Flaviaesturariibacter amylovorans TaxID=1084520 RepID=A0ABP8GBN3_9BACT
MNTILKMIVPVAGALVLATLLQKGIEKGSARYHVHKKERMNEILRGTTRHDILFLGSSRMHNTVNPRVVDSVTGLNTYNAGAEGGRFVEFRTVLEGYLAKHPAPRLVVLSVDGHSFYTKTRMFFPIQYFDHLDNPVVATAFREQKEDFNWMYLKYLTPLRIIYYDDYAKSLAFRGLRGSNELKMAKTYNYKGYLSNGTACIDTLHAKPYKKVTLIFDEEGRKAFQDIQRICAGRNIPLRLVYVPEWRGMMQQSFNNFPQWRTVLDSLRGNTPLDMDDNLPLSQDPCNFANFGHVNDRGAALYSALLGQRLKPLITNP